MARVAEIVPVLPVPLVATVLLAQGERALGELDIKAEVGRLVSRLQGAQAYLYLPRGDWDYAVSAGLRMLVQRRLVEQADGLFRSKGAERPLLNYYANSIAHLLAPR
jgi:glycerol-3-phosphate O-acyltransferase